ncbi:Bug family tripartite tricarboxylate transporter substrate binding protein [Cupriavidus basilensis]|uniref:Bug family tripartite tricarboxylate transporter substrate binding protein n=1 Tax=Cupriavidus basilensis TaxID=68895 RepID=UPI0039F6E0B5
MRHILACLAAAAALVPCLQSSAVAADWPDPSKPVQIIVPAPGGGGTADTLARVLAEQLHKQLHATVIIESRGGANGNIGVGMAAAAVPDGYKFLFSWAGTLAVNPSLYAKLPFDSQKSFTPVALVADVPNILVINKSLPVKNLTEFIAYAKANPDKLNYGSTGNGSSMHVAGELFMRETGTRLIHVPYSSPGQATTNLLADDIQAMFQLVPGILGQVKSGKVRALAVMSSERSLALPDVPTAAELGHSNLMSSTWFAMLAPRNTPEPIVMRMNAALNEVLRDPEVIRKFTEMGATPLGGTPQQLTAHLAAELVKWRAVVSQASIKIQ